ncbi:hypothetical protein RF11_10006 [Thelohanellus kitauei]|uniref:Uncharacterized protein n=1 Tax=Thelohanellus kitauei TaxID=669202 RepID=A0A0C2IH81_THEKT|nr:hypothetical protein RF11_10006 [Thelohanellus kitauei]
MESPKSMDEFKSFCGLINYDLNYISLAIILTLLTDLLQKDSELKWDKDQQPEFEKPKDPPSAPIKSWTPPPLSSRKNFVDFLGPITEKSISIIEDDNIKYPEAFLMDNTTTKTTIDCLSKFFQGLESQESSWKEKILFISEFRLVILVRTNIKGFTLWHVLLEFEFGLKQIPGWLQICTSFDDINTPANVDTARVQVSIHQRHIYQLTLYSGKLPVITTMISHPSIKPTSERIQDSATITSGKSFSPIDPPNFPYKRATPSSESYVSSEGDFDI